MKVLSYGSRRVLIGLTPDNLVQLCAGVPLHADGAEYAVTLVYGDEEAQVVERMRSQVPDVPLEALRDEHDDDLEHPCCDDHD